jgi:hypothetical protein
MAGDGVVPTGPGLGAEVSEDTARSPGWIGDVRQSPGLQKLAADPTTRDEYMLTLRAG